MWRTPVHAAALAVALTCAGAVAPAWLTVQGRATGGGPPRAWAASAVGVTRSAGSWGRAIEVPGLGALNRGGGIAGVNSVSCASAGNCAAVGQYFDRHGHEQGFVVTERRRRWGLAIEVPGLGALNKGDAEVSSVSCASAGNCTAGGYYTDGGHHRQGFVVIQRRGRWGRAIEVPGLGALNKGVAQVLSVSCASARNCAAGGFYNYNGARSQGFVVTERDGRWGRAIEVPGLGALNKGRYAVVFSVSCASAGNCAAGGYYTDGGRHHQGFVADERDGVWGTAIEVPGLGALNKGGNAKVNSVSCASAGNCAAGGDYSYQGFVADERDGVWGTATEVPGLGALNTGFTAEVDSVSCASAGNCAAGGNYLAAATGFQGFVALERDSVWGRATGVPGLHALNKGGGASVGSVSCQPTGTCAISGQYTTASSSTQGFVAVERDGVWGRATEVPGLGALNKGGSAEVSSVSCPPAGICAAGGSYTDRRGHFQGFVVSQTG